MRAGIVILNYNTAEMTVALAERCAGFRSIQHVVVIDNASTDGSQQTLGDAFGGHRLPKVDLILHESNDGYAVGNNIGLRHLVEDCGCDVAIVSNPDVSFSDETVGHMLDAFDRHPGYDVLSTASVASTPGRAVRQYWGLPSYARLLFENFLLGQRHYDKREAYSCDESADLLEVGVVPGAFFAIRARTLLDVGYLDEGTFLYFEENCLSQRVRAVGGKVGILPHEQFTVITDRPNSTSVIQRSTFAREYYVRSKEHYARTYMTQSPVLLGLLHLADRWFVFEKWVQVRLARVAGRDEG